MKRKGTQGMTSVMLPIFINDTTSSVGGGLSGVVFNSAGLVGEYRGEADATWATISNVTATLGTYTSGGFIVDGNLAGAYCVMPPNLAFSSARGRWTNIRYYGAANMKPVEIEVELDAVNYQDSVRFGMTALANAAFDTLLGHPSYQSLTRQLFRTQGAVWFVATTGSDSNAGTTWATAFATVSKAATSASAGDVIIVGAGTINQGSTTITLPANVRLKGAGMGLTIISCSATSGGGTYIITAGSDVSIEDVTVNATGSGANSYAFPIGDGGTLATNINLRRVETYADTDGVYLSASGSSLFFDDCRFNSNWDCVFGEPFGGAVPTIQGKNSTLITTGPSVCNATKSSTVSGDANTRLRNCTIINTTTSSTVTGDGAVTVMGGKFELDSCAISVSGTNVYDIYNGGTLVLANTQYNVNNVHNTGTITTIPTGGNIDMTEPYPGSPTAGTVGAAFADAASILSAATETLALVEALPSAGTGSKSVSVLLTSDGTTPIVGGLVSMTVAQSAGPIISNGSGIAGTFGLIAGAVTVNVFAAGYVNYSQQHTVQSTGFWDATSSATLTLTLVANAPTPATAPSTANGYCTTRVNGTPKVSVVFNYKLVRLPASTVTDFESHATQTATSDSVTGLLQLPMLWDAGYLVWPQTGCFDDAISVDPVPTNVTTFELPPGTGDF